MKQFYLCIMMTVILMISVAHASEPDNLAQKRLNALDKTISELKSFQQAPFEKDASRVLRGSNLRGRLYIDCDQWPVECREGRRKIKVIDQIVTQLINDLYDEDYDSNDWTQRPMMKVWPPRGAVKGIVFGGVYPDSIEDKEIRAKYLMMIEANNDKRVNSGIQDDLRSLMTHRNPENYTPQKIRIAALDKTLKSLKTFQKAPLEYEKAWLILRKSRLQLTPQIDCVQWQMMCEQELSQIKAIDQMAAQIVDELYDAEYDPNAWENREIAEIWPPEDPVNSVLSRWLYPSQVADEALRARYLVIVNENEKRFRQRTIQERLRALMAPDH